METDVLIIGAGPAGLNAAIEMASRGLDVVIVDELNRLGGQLCQQTQWIKSLPAPFHQMRGFELAEKLIQQVNEFPVLFLLEHRVVGLYQDGSVGVTDDENVYPVKAKKILVATGAAENPVPFLKWTLPGIMTIGAAQTLINREFVVPGKDSVIVGSSDFAMDVALQLIETGVNIKGILEQTNQVKARDEEKIKNIQKHQVPIYCNAFIKEARGKGQVEEIDIQHNEKTTSMSVDLICLDGGRTPILDVFYQLGCFFGYQEKLGGWIPQYNERLQTSDENVFIAGNAAGISSQGVLLLTGTIAGISVCEALNVMKQEEAQLAMTTLWKELELLETKEDVHKWQGRITHIGNFSNPKIKDQFIS